MKEEELYREAANLWSVRFQIPWLIEEMSELMTELCHEMRDKGSIEGIIEEITDVEIMLGQVKMLYPSTESIKEERLNRLKLRIAKENYIRQRR